MARVRMMCFGAGLRKSGGVLCKPENRRYATAEDLLVVGKDFWLERDYFNEFCIKLHQSKPLTQRKAISAWYIITNNHPNKK